MGYELARFQDGVVDEELLCSICRMVLENPVQFKHCEHAFCDLCISEWLRHKNVCPIDRNLVSKSDLIPTPRILRNLLGKLSISCNNKDMGCPERIPLETLHLHIDVCNFNPTRQVQCEAGCGCLIEVRHLAKHNCLLTLGSMIRERDEDIVKLNMQIKELKQVVSDQHREIMLVKEMVRNLRLSSISAGLTSESETETIRARILWLSSLQPAKITRWGGMISTPDAVLQSVVKRALVDSGCPVELASQLIINSHERRWPSGLSMLETRQSNRHRYEEFIPKRIPTKQAVVLMSCENEHMGESMIREPGFVIIFAHGVE